MNISLLAKELDQDKPQRCNVNKVKQIPMDRLHAYQ